MKDLSKKLHEKLQKIDEGKLGIEELEELVNDAQELYEKLLILKFKAYEKFGNPEELLDEVVEDELEASTVEDVVETVPEEKEVEIAVPEVEEEAAIEFSAEPEEEEEGQPSFDFSASEEVGAAKEEIIEEVAEVNAEDETFPEDADIKNVAPSDKEETDTFPEDEPINTPKGDIFKDSHVEKHEPEDSNSLNQTLQDEDDELSLRKKLQSTPVTDLKSEISIAKKFEYITFMFDGKNEIYEEAINSLNTCANGEEAKNKLNEYSTTYNWDLENKSIIKFVELVERRYI